MHNFRGFYRFLEEYINRFYDFACVVHDNDFDKIRYQLTNKSKEHKSIKAYIIYYVEELAVDSNYIPLFAVISKLRVVF